MPQSIVPVVEVVEVVAPQVDHLRGCPAPPDRIESYPAKSPAGEHLIVTRCLECGGHTIHNQAH